QAAWDAGAAAIDEIQRLVQKEQIECEFTRVPAYVHVYGHSFSQKEISRLKKEGSLAAKLGFDTTYLESVPYFNLPGVRYPNQAKFHRSEEHTSELQSLAYLVCRLLLEKK